MTCHNCGSDLGVSCDYCRGWKTKVVELDHALSSHCVASERALASLRKAHEHERQNWDVQLRTWIARAATAEQQLRELREDIRALLEV